MLRGEVATLHTELTNTRSAHSAFDKVLQEKCDLQKQVRDGWRESYENKNVFNRIY